MEVTKVVLLGLSWGAIFGLVFSLGILIIGRINAEMLLNDYPPDIRRRHGPMSKRTRKQAKLATILLLMALGIVILLAFSQYQDFAGKLTFTHTLLFTTVIFQTWNLIDLVLLDWLLLMAIKPGFMILSGTEGMAGYNDYGFHFHKFLNGTLFTLIPSLLITVVALVVQAFF